MNEEKSQIIFLRDFFYNFSEELKKRKVSTFLIFIIFLFYGIYKILQIEKKYIATYSAFLNENQDAISLSAIASQIGFSGGSEVKFNMDRFNHILRSDNLYYRTMLSSIRINGKQDLIVNHYEKRVLKKNPEENTFFENWLSFLKLKNDENDSVVFTEGDSLSNISLQKVKKLRLLKMGVMNLLEYSSPDEVTGVASFTCKSSDEQFTAEFLKTIFFKALDYEGNLSIKEKRKGYNDFKIKLDSIVRLRNQKEQELAKLKDSRIGIVKKQDELVLDRLVRDISFLNIEYEKINSQTEISKISLGNNRAPIVLLDSPIYPLEYAPRGRAKKLIGYFFLALAVSIIPVLYKIGIDFLRRTIAQI